METSEAVERFKSCSKRIREIQKRLNTKVSAEWILFMRLETLRMMYDECRRTTSNAYGYEVDLVILEKDVSAYNDAMTR